VHIGVGVGIGIEKDCLLLAVTRIKADLNPDTVSIPDTEYRAKFCDSL
jgi:hypothetical protein